MDCNCLLIISKKATKKEDQTMLGRWPKSKFIISVLSILLLYLVWNVWRTEVECLGIFNKKGLAFEKIELSKSKINSDKTATIKVNVKNYKEKFENIVLKIKTDDENNQYLTISTTLLQLPALDFPNRSTGDHEIIINPHNIPVNKMSFKIIVEVYANNVEKPMLKKEFDLTVNKK